MIGHISLHRLDPEVTDDELEDMLRTARSLLLKIHGVLNVKSGKRVESGNRWQFFLYLEFDSLDKMAMCKDDPVYIKYTHDVIRPHSIEEQEFTYELDPGKDIKYS